MMHTALAQEIVARTMRVLPHNINVMDEKGSILASGDPRRIGQLHDGALLALSQDRVVEIDRAMAKQLYGVKPGVNLPLYQSGEIIGVVGITGDPLTVRPYAELVKSMAEMMLEQAQLQTLLASDQRQREELVLHLISDEVDASRVCDWAQRLGIDLSLPRVAAVLEVDSQTLGVDTALEELRQLHVLLLTPERGNLIANASLNRIVVLKPIKQSEEGWNLEDHRLRVEKLFTRLPQNTLMGIRFAMGQYFDGLAGLAQSYRSALATLFVGKAQRPDQRAYFYQDWMLPVLLSGLKNRWQAQEMVRPLLALQAKDHHGTLQKTLCTWLKHHGHAKNTAKALHIHRNTLEYRLQRIQTLTLLDLNRLDHCLLLYAANEMQKVTH